MGLWVRELLLKNITT